MRGLRLDILEDKKDLHLNFELHDRVKDNCINRSLAMKIRRFLQEEYGKFERDVKQEKNNA